MYEWLLLQIFVFPQFFYSFFLVRCSISKTCNFVKSGFHFVLFSCHISFFQCRKRFLELHPRKSSRLENLKRRKEEIQYDDKCKRAFNCDTSESDDSQQSGQSAELAKNARYVSFVFIYKFACRF